MTSALARDLTVRVVSTVVRVWVGFDWTNVDLARTNNGLHLNLISLNPDWIIESSSLNKGNPITDQTRLPFLPFDN